MNNNKNEGLVSFNEKVGWSMHNDRNPLKRQYTDKLQLKEYVKDSIGEGYTPKTFVISDNTTDLLKEVSAYKGHPQTYMIKANNDSGGTAIVRDGVVDPARLRNVETWKDADYGGIRWGEWFYEGIKYKCFTEEFLADNLIDYKFHCSAGEPRFCHVIKDRLTGINECSVDLDGVCHDFHFSGLFPHVRGFNKPKNWEKMKDIARILCKPFDYVRVDMYNVDIDDPTDSSIFIGELTFAPNGANYPGPGQVEAGKLLIGL